MGFCSGHKKASGRNNRVAVLMGWLYGGVPLYTCTYKINKDDTTLYLITNGSLDETKEDFIGRFGFSGFWPVSYSS